MPGGRARAPGPRSFELLDFVARLDVASVAAVQCAFALSRSVTYSHLQRMHNAALVSRVRGYGYGSAVAITRDGRKHLALPGDDVPAGAQYGLGLRHSQAVSWVAALLELRGRSWASDREMRSLPSWQVPVMWPASRGTHRPDLGAVISDVRVAIEIERTQKRARRLRAILAGYEDRIATGELGGVIYIYEHAAIGRLVEREAIATGLAKPSFRLRELRDVIAEAQALATRRRGSSHDRRRLDTSG